MKYCLIAVSVFFLAVAGTQARADELPPLTDWLAALRVEALEQGIRPEVFDNAFTGFQPIARIYELDRSQPEFTITFEQYVSGRVSESRIRTGRQMWAEHKQLLQDVAAAYGVQPEYILAIWGMESAYGQYKMPYPVVHALATLAYDTRRPDTFRAYLLDALKIINEGHIAPDHMMGGWAGAMGQPQFMPTSFFHYARDFNGDGRRDIWETEADVFASIAYYLQKHGWRADTAWGMEVKLPAGFAGTAQDLLTAGRDDPPSRCRAWQSHTKSLPLVMWQGLGVRQMDGSDLPDMPQNVTLVFPEGTDGRAFLATVNYGSILRYNCSNFYALAVSLLADALK